MIKGPSARDRVRSVGGERGRLRIERSIHSISDKAMMNGTNYFLTSVSLEYIEQEHRGFTDVIATVLRYGTVKYVRVHARSRGNLIIFFVYASVCSILVPSFNTSSVVNNDAC